MPCAPRTSQAARLAAPGPVSVRSLLVGTAAQACHHPLTQTSPNAQGSRPESHRSLRGEGGGRGGPSLRLGRPGIILDRNILEEKYLQWPQQFLVLFPLLLLALPCCKWIAAVALILSLEKAKVRILESLKQANQLQMRKRERKEEKRRNNSRVKQMSSGILLLRKFLRNPPMSLVMFNMSFLHQTQ